MAGLIAACPTSCASLAPTRSRKATWQVGLSPSVKRRRIARCSGPGAVQAVQQVDGWSPLVPHRPLDQLAARTQQLGAQLANLDQELQQSNALVTVKAREMMARFLGEQQQRHPTQHQQKVTLNRSTAALAAATGATVQAASGGAVLYSFRSSDAVGGIAGILEPQPTAFELAQRHLASALPPEAAAGLQLRLSHMPGSANSGGNGSTTEDVVGGNKGATLYNRKHAPTSIIGKNTGTSEEVPLVEQAGTVEAEEASRLAEQAACRAAEYERLLSVAGRSQVEQPPQQQRLQAQQTPEEVAAALWEASQLAQRAAGLAAASQRLQGGARDHPQQKRLVRPGQRSATSRRTPQDLMPQNAVVGVGAVIPSTAPTSREAARPALQLADLAAAPHKLEVLPPVAAPMSALLDRWSRWSDSGAPDMTCITSRPSLPGAAGWLLAERVYEAVKSVGATFLPPVAQAPVAVAVSLGLLAAAIAPLW